MKLEERLFERVQLLWCRFQEVYISTAENISSEVKSALMLLNSLNKSTSFNSNNCNLNKSRDIEFIHQLIAQTTIEKQYKELMDYFADIIKSRPSSKKASLGQVTTPFPIIKEIIAECKSIKSTQKIPETLKWLDVGCGPGFFISWIMIQELIQESIKNSGKTEKISANLHDIEYWHSLKARLGAIDIDSLSIHMAKRFASMILLLLIRHEGWHLSHEIIEILPPIQFFAHDFLDEKSPIDGFKPTIIVGNPPYIFSRNLTPKYRMELKNSCYSSAQGQFDISDVFIERSIQLLPPNGVLGLIIPEILLSLSSRRNIRRILINSSNYIFIREVQETFQTANVENIELFIRKSHQQSDPMLKIEKTNIQGETQVIFEGNKIKPQEIEQEIEHNDRLLDLLHIKNESKYSEIVEFVERKFYSINEWNELHPQQPIFVFRGVELSKKGVIIQCTNCGLWMPFSRKILKCKHCHRPISQSIIPTKIIHERLDFTNQNRKKNSANSVQKFVQNFPHEKKKLQTDSYIDLEYKGIQYKPLERYHQLRIVVRQLLHEKKICAAEIEPDTMTSQSIYNICFPSVFKDEVPSLVKNLRSDLTADYLFVTFSKGKRLFPRILLNILKEIPFIPKNFKHI
ncbi:MAG: Eco57I restriction-modification methylase domain-containing protein [Promethearchaeota archaeon]